jgi:hypothetical protein
MYMRARFQMLVGLIVVVGGGGLVIWAFVEAVRTEPAVVGSIGVAVVGVLGVVWQQRQSERARLREAHRDRMTPVYYDLLGAFKKFTAGAAEQDPEIEELFIDLKSRQLLLGASSQMVRAFNAWQGRANELQERGDSTGAVLAWEELLLAIRKDLGHQDSDLPQGELLRLFVTDYDDHFGDQRLR